MEHSVRGRCTAWCDPDVLALQNDDCYLAAPSWDTAPLSFPGGRTSSPLLAHTIDTFALLLFNLPHFFFIPEN